MRQSTVDAGKDKRLQTAKGKLERLQRMLRWEAQGMTFWGCLAILKGMRSLAQPLVPCKAMFRQPPLPAACSPSPSLLACRQLQTACSLQTGLVGEGGSQKSRASSRPRHPPIWIFFDATSNLLRYSYPGRGIERREHMLHMVLAA